MNDKNVFKRIISFVGPYKFLFGLRLLITVLNSIIGLFGNYGISLVIRAETDLNYAFLYFGIGILIFSLIWECFTTIASQMLMSRVSFRSIRDIKNLLIEHFQNLPQTFFDKNHSGDLSSRMTNDISVIQSFISDRLTIYLYYPVRFLTAVIFMVFISWQLLLVSCIIIPIAIYLPKLFSNKVEKASKNLQKALGKVTSIIQDTLHGIVVVKAFNLKETFDEKFDLSNDVALKNDIKLNKLHAINEVFYTIARSGPTITCVIFGTYLAVKGYIQLYQLSFFIFSIDFLAQPIANIPYMFEAWKKTEGAAKRVLELMDEPLEKNGDEANPIFSNKLILEVSNLKFSYNADYIIKDVNFFSKKGSTTALVGPSGCGKSTLFKILCGFYDNYEGSINLLGHELKNWNLSELRKNLSIVTQDAFLFPTTIYENIAMGNENASKEEIIEAAKQSNAHDFIMKMENGYDTYCGERGVKLSGGQKQRITIARAILKNAPILFFDEPTSALDTQSEALVQSAIDKMMEGKTVFIIAHRLTTIKNAENVIVLNNGKIEAIGSHDALLEESPLYKKLYYKEQKLIGGGDILV